MYIEVTDSQFHAIQIMIDHGKGAGDFDEVPYEYIVDLEELVSKNLDKQGTSNGS